MKRAAMVLGIVGGSLAILISLFYLLTFGFIYSIGPTEHFEYKSDEEFGPGGGEWDSFQDTADYSPFARNSDFYSALPLLLFFGLGIIGGGLGLAGGILVPKKSVLGGVFMCVAAVLTALFCVTFIVLLLGGIFALVKGKDGPAPATV